MSNNLIIDQMVPSQDQKETVNNDGNGQLDAAITEIVDIDIDNTNARTLTSLEFVRQFRFSLIDGSPVPTAAVTLTIPAVKRGLFLVDNALAFNATVEISGQTAASPIVPSLGAMLLECDGSDVRRAPSFVDMFSPHFAGAPGSSVLISRFVASRPFSIPVGLIGSQGHAGVAATAQTDFDLQLNGGSIGTIRFAAAGTVATFIKATASAVAAGDRIDIISPGSADATLADLSFTVVGS